LEGDLKGKKIALTPQQGVKAMRITFTTSTIKELEQEIKKSQKANNLRWFKMAMAIYLIAQGVSREEIRKRYQLGEKTVYNWLVQFLVNRFSFFNRWRCPGRGRKCKLSKHQQQELKRIIEDGPEKAGFTSGVWTASMIGVVMMTKYHVGYNVRYICQLLKKLGLSYQKAAFISDHLDEEKRREWVHQTWPHILNLAKEKHAVIIFVDEVSFAQWGSLSRTWAVKGHQPKIKTTGKRKGLKMFGAIEFFKGRFHYQETEDKFNGETYKSFLIHVMEKYKCPVILIEDGAKYHIKKEVEEFKHQMEQANKLHCFRLPTYSPDYNPIEKLWKKTKAKATHCKYFPTFDSLRQAVVDAFTTFMNDAAQVLSVMNKLRIEAGVV
jgi:transposase